MATATVSQVQALYVGYLGRAGDQDGLNFWLNAIRTDVSTLESVALGFTLSQEYQGLYGELGTPELVAAVYQNVLGREAEGDGLAFWINEIESGVITADTLVASMINSLGEIDQRTIDNKIFVANVYTAAAGDDYNPAAGARIIANVNADPVSVSTALKQLEDGSLPGLVPGLALFNALAAAKAELAGYATQLADDYPEWDTGEDGSISLAEAQAALSDAKDARAEIGGGEPSNVLAARLDTAEANYATARTAAVALTGGEEAVTAYDEAVAEYLALESDEEDDIEAALAKVETTETAVRALGDAGVTYVGASEARVEALQTLRDAQEAEATIGIIEGIISQYQSLERAVETAGTALETYLSANPAVSYIELQGDDVAATSGNDVFVFAEALNSDDFAIAGFGSQGNDNLVLGNTFTFNSGAVGTGDNNTFEYFIVQSEAGAQVIIETKAFGSTSVTAATDGTITASPEAAVITLTGVSAEDLQVSNGVISLTA